MNKESRPRAILSAVLANRRRYGGYFVHAGFATLLIAVAASTAFDHTHQLTVAEGGSFNLRGAKLTYLKPTSKIVLTKAGAIESINIGALVRVERGGKVTHVLQPTHDFYPSIAYVKYGEVGRYFNGEESSEISLKTGPGRDLWLAMTPDDDAVTAIATKVQAGYNKVAPSLTPTQAGAVLGKAIQGTVDTYIGTRPAMTFRAIDAPGVVWVWIGAFMMGLGVLLSLSQPTGVRTRARAAALGRVSRELAGTTQS